MFAAWAINNWKPIGLLALILLTLGYIRLLQYKVDSRDETISVLESNVTVLTTDLANANGSIAALDNGIAQYQSFVTRAINNVQKTQAQLAAQNKAFQAVLDNLVIPASTAKRIIDAPIIPFFMDNVAGNRGVLIGVRNGVYHFRMRGGQTHTPNAVPVHTSRDPRGTRPATEARGRPPL